MRRTVALFMLLALCRTAGADREQQGQQLFQTRCANCHAIGHGEAQTKLPHGLVDLTLTARAHNDAWLRTWLKGPHAVKADARCYTAGLDPSQLDQLLAFFHARAEPVHKVVMPRGQAQPPRPPDPPPPLPGLVRGR